MCTWECVYIQSSTTIIRIIIPAKQTFRRKVITITILNKFVVSILIGNNYRCIPRGLDPTTWPLDQHPTLALPRAPARGNPDTTSASRKHQGQIMGNPMGILGYNWPTWYEHDGFEHGEMAIPIFRRSHISPHTKYIKIHFIRYEFGWFWLPSLFATLSGPWEYVYLCRNDMELHYMDHTCICRVSQCPLISWYVPVGWHQTCASPGHSRFNRSFKKMHARWLYAHEFTR